MSSQYDDMNISQQELGEITSIVSKYKTIFDLISHLGPPAEVIHVNSKQTRDQYRFCCWQTVSLVILEGNDSELTYLAIPTSA